MSALPPDVWAMMIFTILVFFGVATWALVYSLRQEEEKMQILRAEGTLDTHSPAALRDLRAWIESHPGDPEVGEAREVHDECVEILKTTNRHFYEWSEADIDALRRL